MSKSKVIQFPKGRVTGSLLYPQAPKRKRGEMWRYVHLNGRRPRGHPLLCRGPRGKALLAVGQVWVELHTDFLMQIVEIGEGMRSGTYPNNVTIVPYLSRSYYAHTISEQSLRATMLVWDDIAKFKVELTAKLNRVSESDPSSPFRGVKNGAARARRFFGLDADGNRIK